jgi:hypothetical protein
MSPFTRWAVEFLKNGQPGDTVTRQRMSEIVTRECSVHGPGYGNVNSAIRHVEKVHGIVWRWCRERKAWACLTDPERVTETRSGLGRARRQTTRALHVATTVDAEKLDGNTRDEHRVNMATASMIHLCASGGFRKRLTEIKDSRLSQPDPRKLIDLMKA